jgi:hypothetical protein
MRQDIFQLRIHQSVDIDELKREVQIIGRILSQTDNWKEMHELIEKLTCINNRIQSM